MQFLAFFGALVVAGIGQYFNAHPRFPSWISKAAMALVGLGFYALAEQPKAWNGQPFLDWLDTAWLWAAALPGVASMLALAPNFQTKDPK